MRTRYEFKLRTASLLGDRASGLGKSSLRSPRSRAGMVQPGVIEGQRLASLGRRPNLKRRAFSRAGARVLRMALTRLAAGKT